MIRYTLTCDNDHSFESWFQSSAAFETLQKANHVACAVCGSTKVSKSVMAPAVSSGTPEKGALTAPASPEEAKLAKFREEIESKSDYVGTDFAREARDIHDGKKPERAIHGEATPPQARKLLEDGVPVLPLPFLPRKRSN